MSKVSIIKEFWEFMRVRKKFWLAPIVIMLFFIGSSGGICPELKCGTIYLYTFLIRNF